MISKKLRQLEAHVHVITGKTCEIILTFLFLVTVVSVTLICWLIYSEVRYYMDSRFIFKFSPDTDMDAKLKINVDLTVAMPCQCKL